MTNMLIDYGWYLDFYYLETVSIIILFFVFHTTEVIWGQTSLKNQIQDIFLYESPQVWEILHLKSLQSYEIQKIKLLWTQFQDSRSQDIIHNQSTYFRKKCWLTDR
jgi:hypothetical protein